MRVLILFPGKTDESTYGPIVSTLEQEAIPYVLRLASAHKSPDLVKEILTQEFDLVISGAGLSAALPGVIASETLAPVLGVPCPGAYAGLDAFLSIAQMPPGVPVLCVSARNAAAEAIKILTAMESGTRRVNLVGGGKSAAKAVATLRGMAVEFARCDCPSDGVNVVFTPMGTSVEGSDHLVVYCPEAHDSRAEDAVRSMASCSSGLWVGLNRGENAAIAAVQILRDSPALTAIRNEFEQKCRREDRQARRCFEAVRV